MLVPPLSDPQWDLVRACLPRPARGGRPRADARHALEAVLLVLANGWRWNDLPVGGGVALATAWRHLRVWQQAGVWPRMWRAYVLSLDPAGRRLWSKALLACAFVPAHREERRWAPATRGARRIRRQAAQHERRCDLRHSRPRNRRP